MLSNLPLMWPPLPGFMRRNIGSHQRIKYGLLGHLSVQWIGRVLVKLILGGGLKYSFIFIPSWKNDPIWLYFSDGLVQPQTRIPIVYNHPCHAPKVTAWTWQLEWKDREAFDVTSIFRKIFKCERRKRTYDEWSIPCLSMRYELWSIIWPIKARSSVHQYALVLTCMNATCQDSTPNMAPAHYAARIA